MIKFYGYKKCSTCTKAEKLLKEAGIAYEFIDITEYPPKSDELARIAQLADVPLKKLFNTSGLQYREMNIKDKLPGLTDDAILSLLSANGRLVKRPLLLDENKATVGFKEQIFSAIWNR